MSQKLITIGLLYLFGMAMDFQPVHIVTNIFTYGAANQSKVLISGAIAAVATMPG